MLRFYRVLASLFAVIVAARFISWVVLVFFVIQDHDDVAYPEGARVYAARRVAAAQPLYQDFRRVPHVMVPYGPLYFEVVGRLDRWFGGDAFASYIVARSTSLACFVALMLLVAVWATEISASWRWGVTIAAFAAACPTLFGPSVGAQVDSLAMLASAGALFLATRAWGEWRWGVVWLLALAAWAAKQNAIALAPALAVWLWQSRDWKAASYWLAAWLLGVFALFGILHWTTGGLFTLNALVSLKRPLVLQIGLAELSKGAVFAGITIVGAVVCWRRAARSEPTRLPAWWFLFSLIPAVSACFGEGGGANYLMEPWLAACLLLAHMLSGSSTAATPGESGRVEALARPAARPGAARTVWLALLILGGLHDTVFFFPRNTFDHVSYFQQVPATSRRAGLMPNLERLIKRQSGDVFVPHAYLAVTCARRPPAVLDVVHYRLMVQGGIISPDELVGRFARREYALLVLREPLVERYDATKFMRWPEAVWRAMQQNYRSIGELDGQFVYQPANADAE